MCASFYMLWQSSASNFTEFRIKIEVEARVAAAEAARIGALHEKTLKETKDDWNKRLPQVRSGAVAAYIAAHPERVLPPTDTGAVPGAGNGPGIPDGTGKECVPDTVLIQDCADDALKIFEWQTWARKNELLVK